MLRKGFTLIELLIVITIIAILAGAAIPYVQDYVEDARISTAKADMNEIKTALIRYELDRGTEYTAATIGSLVGAYLGKSITDPWGSAYIVSSTNNHVRSLGPNRSDDLGLGDDIIVDYRPPLAVSKAYFVDADNSATVTSGDTIRVRFTRPIAPLGVLTQAHWGIVLNGVTGTFLTRIGGTANMTTTTVLREAVITFASNPTTQFITGRDAIFYDGAANNLYDTVAVPTRNECGSNDVAIKPLK